MNDFSKQNLTLSNTNQFNFKKQHVFISGGLGTGKTTLFNLLKNYVEPKADACFIKEYINYDSKGEEYLEQLFNKELTNYRFQLYIIDCYEEQLNTPEYEAADLIVWERHPMESLYIFCNSEHELADAEKFTLKMKLERLCEKYQIPHIYDAEFQLLNLDTSTLSIDSTFNYLMLEYIYPILLGEMEGDIFILLYCSDLKEQFDRVINRGRISECNHYKEKEDLLPVNSAYDDLFFKLINTR
ncbi:hypothetical protein EDI_011070 [Entamoeba dispar SAW760]|uniref:Deoxynucleoside kinase domain-containing protein n=1 Tax=Entamoeba dispar (strain ATCC PRA-260 / SAW760) TaxID=370354 RepID=B0ES82_ENTDS|nr:uncharacterized protein EDI_011070 [Entamoeba dispar SAW760]EDR22607.1 hypothetical protein EDI_011070 [Entamoeba dispar SAW760]|eukprot:EDR22607.1 hypothetical protein EDI_011070 [Entamoeba dispar SAW760]